MTRYVAVIRNSSVHEQGTVIGVRGTFGVASNIYLSLVGYLYHFIVNEL